MVELATIAFFLGVIAYSAAATLFFLDLTRRASGVLAPWAPITLGVGAVFHATHVVSASLLSRVCPVESIHFALSLTALMAVVTYLALRRRFRLHAVGAFVAPVALTFLVGAQFVGIHGPPPGVPRSLLALHVTANLLGVGLFLLAGAAGGFYVLHENRLKQKRAGWLTGKLPPLEALDRTEHRLLLAGFPLLTLGIVTGAVFASGGFGGTFTEVLRAVLAYGTWLLVAAVLVMRVLAGWRGRRAAYGTIAGAVCVLLIIALYVVRPSGGGL